MRYSKALIPTLREAPAEAEVLSHQLMLRAGYIKQVARGIYTYLPLGWRVLKKIINIVREELDKVDCEELQMPCVTPAELWEQSGRWPVYGKELLRLRDRHNREFCFGPTHEEVITSTVAASVKSYKELPKNLYQIHTKFRDEIRPRFGLMRGREFIMKDGYSFHANEEDLDREYNAIRGAYQRIFERCGLSSRVVDAATGNIGGKSSHEVMVLAETGEDEIAHCESCGYAANVELASSAIKQASSEESRAAVPSVKEVETPGMAKVNEVSRKLGVAPAQMIKTLVFLRDGGLIVALVAGDRELNEGKLKNVTDAEFVTMADEQTVQKLTNAEVGFAGPVGLPKEVAGVGRVSIIADHGVMAMISGGTGGNKTDIHLINVVPGRDFVPDLVADVCVVVKGDLCPQCTKHKLETLRGIEVGHIFKLGTKYSKPLGATFLDANGESQPIIMGTYGLGISRTAAAAIEQNHDEKGIIWPLPIAPFHVALLLLNSKNEDHVAYADKVYQELRSAGVEVIYDDRADRAGVKFADAELIGIPYVAVIGGKAIDANMIELKSRRTGEAKMCSVADAVKQIHSELDS